VTQGSLAGVGMRYPPICSGGKLADDQVAHATLQDVARHAGVSLATASRVLNGSTRRVREDLSERVLKSATRLSYAVNTHAQAMARGRANIVGLIVHDIADPYFSTIAAGVMSAAESHGLLVTLASAERSQVREIEYLAAFRAQRARAAILAGSRWARAARKGRLGQELALFERGGGRALLIGQPRLDIDTISMENRSGAKQLAIELVSLGYRRFAVLAGPPEFLTARDRAEGFRRGLATAGLVLGDHLVVTGEFTRDGGYDAMTTFLQTGTSADCVFAVNDVMAVGALAALRDQGRQVPAEIAVAGFDDILTLRDVAPGLTTVRMPLRGIGEQALAMVLEPAPDQPRIRRVKGHVVIRASTPPRN